ncbi:MAG: hypothetical protein [Microvirus sp.]|nr:MAG: hypothetical protein [Microvirus sp.]
MKNKKHYVYDVIFRIKGETQLKYDTVISEYIVLQCHADQMADFVKAESFSMTYVGCLTMASSEKVIEKLSLKVGGTKHAIS